MIHRLILAVLIVGFFSEARAADLSRAPSEDLLRVYAELRALKGSSEGGVAENVEFKRDAATFRFLDGRMTFAAPVEGRVLAVVFQGRGVFELSPPTAIEQRQISRFTKGGKLVDGFRQAVFFFTDDSADELRKLVNIRSDADEAAATHALAGAQSKYSESFNDWWSNVRSGNFPMRNLAARMLADLTDPTSRGFFFADFKGENSGDLLYHVSWNRDPILLPDINNSDEVMLLHVNRSNYHEWWAGFHLAEEYSKSSHPDHRTLLAHTEQETIDLEVTKDNHVAATAEMNFEVIQGAPRLLPFNLGGVLRVSSIEDGGGNKLPFIQEDRKLDNDPWLILPEPAKIGTPYKVKISYREDSTHDSRIIDQNGSGLYFVKSRTSWFPSFGAFDDRTQFVLNVRSPKKFKFLATGSMVKSDKGKDALETQWKSQIPFSVVGFNYGDFVDKSQSDPKLSVTAYAGKEVPDELKAFQADLQQAELALGPGHGDIAGRMGIMTGGFNTAANAKYAAGVSYQALKLYEYYFGDLPFKEVSVTEQPIRGFGQSWPTLIFLPYDSLLDSTTRQSLRLQQSAEAREFYSVVAVHEMAHQWWGHLVGWKTYHDEWLSEGFADFSAGLYLQRFDPGKVEDYWQLKRKWLLSADSAGNRPVDVGPIWLGSQLPSYMEPGLFRILIYEKGAYVLEMLRTLMWNGQAKDPDSRFIATMRDFTSTYAGKNASTEDFRSVVEKHMGEPMDWFFNEWVYGTEIPEYDFSYRLTDAGGGKTELSMSVKQSGVSDSFVMRVPVYAMVGGQPRRLGMVRVKGSQTAEGKVMLPSRPDKIVLDAEKSILCTVRQ
jgi:Peptidase family M1 domain